MLHINTYILLVLSALTYKYFELSDAAIPWFHAYFEDLLAIPLILKTALLTVQLLRTQWRAFTMTGTEIALITILFAIYFEAMLPLFKASYTADPWDLMCYATGAFFYGLWLNKPLAIRQVATPV